VKNQREINMNNVPGQGYAYSKRTVVLIGIIAGIIGAILGFRPFAIWHESLGGLVESIDVRRNAIISILYLLTYGLGFPAVAAYVVLPLGGAVTGVIGANIGTKRYLKKNTGVDRIRSVAFWWGLVFGFLFNLFVGFYSQ
jgi:hypothetical protein